MVGCVALACCCVFVLVLMVLCFCCCVFDLVANVLKCLFIFQHVWPYLVVFVILSGFGRFRVRWGPFLFYICLLFFFFFGGGGGAKVCLVSFFFLYLVCSFVFVCSGRFRFR